MRKWVFVFSLLEEDALRSLRALRLMFFSFEGMRFLVAGVSFLAMALWVSAPALAQEAISGEEPTPSSVDQITTPMGRTFEEKKPRPGLFPWLKEELKDTPAFFRDTMLDVQLRTYYFRQENTGVNIKEAWALGGGLSYQSGYFLDHFSVGAVLYTSQPLYAPEDRDGTRLLAPGQEGYMVLGQVYGRVKVVEDNFINIYRYEYNTPYINKNDFFMTPNTFEGYAFQGSAGSKDGGPRVTYGVGYIDKIKTNNDSTFQPMSQAAGAQVARGVFAGGFNYFHGGFQGGAINYFSEDIINIGYGEVKYTLAVTELLGVLFAGQFTDQRSVGANLLTGSSFHGSQLGFMTNVSYRNGILTLAYTNTSGGANIQNPWSSYPGYTSSQVQSFTRAGEEAFMVKGSLNFARFGLEELTAYALWVHGWSAINPATNQSVFQQDEYDFDLQWRPKGGFLKGLWFRARYAHVDSRDGNSRGFPIDDLRLIVNYDFPLL
jgi:hypothetical protein